MSDKSEKETKSQRKTAPPETGARERIVSGARKHFLTHGLRGVTMDELAEELGMSKKTLYAHFASKTALVEAALLEKFREIDAQLEAITQESPSDFMATLQKILACFQHHMDEIQPPFIRDIQREAPGMFEVIEERRRTLVQRYLGRFLAEGRKAGIVRDDISVEMMIEILLGAVQMIMNPPKMIELGLTLKAGFLDIIKVFLEGVVTEKGRSRL